jgi:hypothetical protein
LVGKVDEFTLQSRRLYFSGVYLSPDERVGFCRQRHTWQRGTPPFRLVIL